MKLKEPKRLKSNILTTKNKNLKSLDQFIDENIGKKGTKRREEFDREYEVFKIGVLIQKAREEKGLTQEQLAQLAGTNKSYISKLERNLKDIRFSTLQRIINEGLGGHLDISIKFEK
jgi:ribosome-binding protein aMBF1 (putative translation factor)